MYETAAGPSYLYCLQKSERDKPVDDVLVTLWEGYGGRFELLKYFTAAQLTGAAIAPNAVDYERHSHTPLQSTSASTDTVIISRKSSPAAGAHHGGRPPGAHRG